MDSDSSVRLQPKPRRSGGAHISGEIRNLDFTEAIDPITFSHKLDIIRSQSPVPYVQALNAMLQRVEDIAQNRKPQAIWFLEHPHVYTAGPSTNMKDVVNQTNIPMIKTDRGGKFTYHGPGQLLIYFMLNIKSFTKHIEYLDIRTFIKQVQQAVIDSMQEYNITANLDSKDVGIWIEGNKNSLKKAKIASLGLKIKKGIVYHGIAINIDPELTYFDNIVPCGIANCKMTSMQECIGAFDKEEYVAVLQEHLVLQLDLKRYSVVHMSDTVFHF